MPVFLRAPWGSALGGAGFGEDEEGEEAASSRSVPSPALCLQAGPGQGV